MKELLKVTALFALLLAAIPMLTFLKPRENVSAAITAETAALSENTAPNISEAEETAFASEPSEPPADTEKTDTLKVLDFTSGQVMELSLRECLLKSPLLITRKP